MSDKYNIAGEVQKGQIVSLSCLPERSIPECFMLTIKFDESTRAKIMKKTREPTRESEMRTQFLLGVIGQDGELTGVELKTGYYSDDDLIPFTVIENE